MAKAWEGFPSFLGVGGESAFLHYLVFSSQQLLEVVIVDFHSTVWRSWGSEKFKELFQVLIASKWESQDFNTSESKPIPLITRLCYLAHSRHSDNHWGNTNKAEITLWWEYPRKAFQRSSGIRELTFVSASPNKKWGGGFFSLGPRSLV